MSETIKTDTQKDNSVAQAWADTMSTFTERTGLSVAKDAPIADNTEVADFDGWSDEPNSADDDWETLVDPNELDEKDDDWPFASDIEWDFGGGWDNEPTPAEQERSRLDRIKSDAERKNNWLLRRLNAIRTTNKDMIVKYCSPERYTTEQLDKVSKYLEDDVSRGVFSNGTYSILEAVAKHDETGQIAIDILDYEKVLSDRANMSPESIQATQEALNVYHQLHGIDTEQLSAFQQNVQPLIVNNDPEVESLLCGINNWSNFTSDRNRFGVADYTVHCLVQEVNPINLNELLLIRRELPTTEEYRLEQNRIDALELVGTLFQSRDFIHDEMPNTHEILNAMLEYYDSKDNPELHASKRRTLEDVVASRDQWSERYNFFSADSKAFAPFVFNLKNYEKPVHLRKLERDSSASRYGGEVLDATEPAIDCLRRLVENTNPDRLTPPETKVPELNTILQNLRINQNPQTGEAHVDWRQAGELVIAMNQLLVNAQGERGFYPSTVEAVAFTERIATFALRDITKRDWHELPYDPTFKEIVRFSQLTYSGKPYDARKFERFWNGFSDIPNGDLSDENLQAAYNKLQRLVLENLTGLANKYSQNPSTAERTKALWSGNLIREFLALADPNAHRK